MTAMTEGPESTRVCIFDYGSDNVRSVWNLLSTIVPDTVVSNDPEAIESATHLILPGVAHRGVGQGQHLGWAVGFRPCAAEEVRSRQPSPLSAPAVFRELPRGLR